MGLCGWIVFGFFAGLVARAIVPGKQGFGCFGTTALGVGGSFMGGFLASLAFGRGNWRDPEPAGFIGAVVGAIVILVLAEALFGRRRR
jgi:uncharacterized membrane protein YeaQ/YmgE (transglycosylase-associated protein family)